MIKLENLCFATQFIGWAYPLPQFIHSWKSKNADQLQCYTYIFFSYSFLISAVYGKLENLDNIFRISVIGTIIYLIYGIYGFLLKKQYYIAIIAFLAIFFQLAIFLNLNSQASGTVTDLLQIIGSMMCFETIIPGIRTRNGSYFNLQSLILSLINGVAWCLYAVELRDYFVIVPVFIDTSINFFQLILYFVLPQKGLKEEQEEPTKKD
eukprot:TRINITY_DN3720_c0_g1_i2.p1 TRINITY_DN3720_c0_g1~~TRINITY_DN3720_c0_g1_i2.p1  ORF type:complete len:208 (-),score=7.59 TRINITY_DN3720_c0_g1_i2:59-682(-)